MVTVPNAMPAHAHKSRDILAHHQSRAICAMKKRMNVSFFGGPCAKTILFFSSHMIVVVVTAVCLDLLRIYHLCPIPSTRARDLNVFSVYARN